MLLLLLSGSQKYKKANGPVSKAILKLKFTGSKSITMPEKDL